MVIPFFLALSMFQALCMNVVIVGAPLVAAGMIGQHYEHTHTVPHHASHPVSHLVLHK